MGQLEIERKFLLKSLPKVKEDDRFEIEQYYFKNSHGVWERARTYHSEKSGDKYIHTIKKSVSKGVNIEDEYEMSKEEFENFKLKCFKPNVESKHISKERWIYKMGDLKWEVDKFNSGYHLIIAEIEIPTKSYKITFPKYIEEVKLLEVTGLKQFSNRALSLKIDKNESKFTTE
jgi:CYTH domain-containing protein